MLEQRSKKRVKTDKRDAEILAGFNEVDIE